MKLNVEEVFRTEGVPEFTFVQPPNFGEILVDIRTLGKPVIVEGQSGTGKTTAIRKILEESLRDNGFVYLSARKGNDVPTILAIASGEKVGKFVIDDFHRLENDIQANIANIIKVSAEEFDSSLHPKIVIVGINKVGSELIHLVHDISKRCGIHRIEPASKVASSELIRKGEEKLSVKITDHDSIFQEAKGDYWLTQLICQSLCLLSNVTETQAEEKVVSLDLIALRKKVTSRLEHAYQETVKEFCRGRRFRATNDPYLKLLKCVAEQESSIVDLNELANANQDVRGSINNIKESRLATLISSKPICDRYFYYNSDTKTFAIEDPALSYYLKHLDWDTLRTACGFRNEAKPFVFDFAISFAGENRELAREIADQLTILDCSVFFDEYFDANYLGKAWHKSFNDIFSSASRFVVCLLDSNHVAKTWPTFERECFSPRLAEEAVIPIYLDDTPVPGIPADIVGIHFKSPDFDSNAVTDKIVYKLLEKLDDV